jgi:hypothetical protein
MSTCATRARRLRTGGISCTCEQFATRITSTPRTRGSCCSRFASSMSTTWIRWTRRGSIRAIFARTHSRRVPGRFRNPYTAPLLSNRDIRPRRAARPVRTVKLQYLDERTELADLESPRPPNGVSLISRIHVSGCDDAGAPDEATPSLEFGYTGFTPDRRRLIPLSAEELHARSLSDPALELVDLHGQGLPDASS